MTDQEEPQPTPPKWAWYQIALAAVYLNLGVGLYVAQALAHPLWGTTLDFGLLPLVLVVIGLYVVFGPALTEVLLRLFGRGKE